MPGWSTHIEPQGDRLIALGVDDTDGRRVSVSLFDVTDPANPGLIDRESFGEDWAWSSAYDDVKAFTVLEDTLIVPFSGYSSESGRLRPAPVLVLYAGRPRGPRLRGPAGPDSAVLRLRRCLLRRDHRNSSLPSTVPIWTHSRWSTVSPWPNTSRISTNLGRTWPSRSYRASIKGPSWCARSRPRARLWATPRSPWTTSWPPTPTAIALY